MHDIGALLEPQPAANFDGCGPFVYSSAGLGQDGTPVVVCHGCGQLQPVCSGDPSAG